MKSNKYQQLKEIVANALDLPQDKRNEYLDKSCLADEGLRKEVDELLSQMVDDEFLHQNPLVSVSDLNQEQQLSGQVGRIKIDKLMARGGMGEVYLGTDVTLNRQVALKVLNQDFLTSKLSRAAFLNEAQVLSSLQHPNICQVYDFFKHQQNDVLVLELIEGKTLRQVLDDKLSINPINIALQITDALTAAHERGIVHRDLKPDNIMINQSGLVKILDFGLARSGLLEQSQLNSKTKPIDPKHSAKHTQVSGTPGYMSPEQARGEKSSTATDMWSFGLILSELFSKKLPFSAQSSSEQLVEQTKRAKVSIPKNIAKAESKLITGLLSADAKKRPTARVVLNALNHIQKRPIRRLKYASLAALFILIAVSLWKYTSDVQQEKNRALIARADAEDLVGFMLDDLNQQLRALGKLNIMESVANNAKMYYEKLDVDQLQASQGQAAIVLVRISEVLDEKGNKEEAVKLLHRAIAALDALNKKHSNALVKYRLGMAHLNLGEILKIEGEFTQSLVHIEQAVNLGKVIANSTESIIDSKVDKTKRLGLYLDALFDLSDVYRRLDKNDLSLSVIDLALVKAVPAAKENSTFNKNLADLYYRQCTVYYAQDRKDIMLDACLNAMQADKNLYLADKENINHHSNYAADHYVVSSIYRMDHDLQSALEIVTQGLQHNRQLAAWDTNNLRLQNELVGAILEKARLLYELERMDESQKLFEEAHAIIVPLAKDQEEITYLHNLMFSSMYLGKLTLAREMANIITQRGMKTRDLKELLKQLEKFETEKTND